MRLPGPASPPFLGNFDLSGKNGKVAVSKNEIANPRCSAKVASTPAPHSGEDSRPRRPTSTRRDETLGSQGEADPRRPTDAPLPPKALQANTRPVRDTTRRNQRLVLCRGGLHNAFRALPSPVPRDAQPATRVASREFFSRSETKDALACFHFFFSSSSLIHSIS